MCGKSRVVVVVRIKVVHGKNSAILLWQVGAVQRKV
jgi:hypothetical protein